MRGIAFGNQSGVLIDDAIGESESDAAQFPQPEFDGQKVIVAGGRFVLEAGFDDGKSRAFRLPTQQRYTERAEEFTPRLFQDVEVAGIVNMVAGRAFGVSDTVDVAKNVTGHGARLTRLRLSRERET